MWVPSVARVRGFICSSVCGVVFIGCATPSQDPDWQTVFGYEEHAIHHIDLRDFGFPFVPVGILGDTTWLLFDTGNMVGLTLQSPLFERLDLPCSERWRRYDAAGDLISSGCVAQSVRASAFGESHDSLSIYEFFDENLSGIIGPGMIPGTRFTLDYQRELLAVAESERLVEAPGYVALSLIESPRHPRLILVTGSIRGREVLVEIDTGKSRTTVDRSLVQDLGLEETSDGAVVGEIQLGPRIFTVSSARVVDTSGISRGLPMSISLGLGSDVLSEFVFTVDYESGRFWIEQ